MSLPLTTPLTTPVATAHQPHNFTSTTTVNRINSNHTPSPVLRTRPAGWHAKSFGFDWHKRADQHKYQVETGLPEAHAAIVNDDWDLALELIVPEDFGLHWLPSTLQRTPQNGSKDLDASTWAIKLMSRNEDIRNKAIVDMAKQTYNVTSIHKNCLYGTNLLTLCLLKSPRPDVLQHVITLAAKQAPHYLNLPDALGRTPLWVAIENHDQDSMHLLLKAGANPLQACKFSEQAEPSPILSLAAKHADKEIFSDLLRAVVDQGREFKPYDFNQDPLYLKEWASLHSPKNVEWLADQIEALRGPLFCCEDMSGSSYFYRSVVDGSLDKKFASGNEDFTEWLKTLDISPGTPFSIESSPLFAAASAASIQTYTMLAKFLLGDVIESPNNIDTDILSLKVYEKFLLSRSTEELDHFLDHYSDYFPKINGETKSDQKKYLMLLQYRALLRKGFDLNFYDYTRVVKNIWPFLSDTEKNMLLSDAALATDGRMEFIFNMNDFALNDTAILALAFKSVKWD